MKKGKCVCNNGYSENYGKEVCKSDYECITDTECYDTSFYMKCSANKCVCRNGYKWDNKSNSCEFDGDDSLNVSWAYYLWFLMIIPISIVAFSIYFIFRRRRITPGGVIISNNRTITQQYGQQYPNAPPAYTEANTYRY